MASHHTRAFNYESIRDQQEAIEMWRDIALGVGVVVLTIFCPPAGAVAGVVLAGAEMYSAATGKDWGTGRELSDGERILRGSFALFDLIPGAKYLHTVAKSGSVVAAKGLLKTSLKEGFEQGARNFDNGLKLLTKFGDNVLKQVDNFGRQGDQLLNKLLSSGADQLSAGLKTIDGTISQAAQNFRLNMGLEPQLVSGAMPSPGSSSINKISNKLDDFSKARELRVSNLDEVGDTILRDGSHFDEFGKLKPNVRYQAGEHNYLYQTDELGRIKYAHAEDLQLKLHDGRLRHKSRTPDKNVGDHAGHVFGDLFGGSPELDNLVSQAKDVNLIEYRRIERRWESALKSQPPKKVHDVDIRIRYDGSSGRPISFDVTYKIDGVEYFERIKNVNK